MKSCKPQLVLAFAGLVHAGAGARFAEPVPAGTLPMEPAARSAPAVTGMPAMDMNRAQALSFLMGIASLGMAIGADVEDEADESETDPDAQST